ncbi:hypothetical protein AB1Y20_004841 [Prymnesium parvum]|uniref:BTB domain-containing protein n=1 Tax=Prymnesium parvum TaxID=97485 RepID=A0AB34IZX1_PRYPA
MTTLLSGGVALPPRLVRYWGEGVLCDAHIKVEDSVFNAHRLVLASASDYFEALIVNERFADSAGSFELPEMRAEAFAAVLGFMYHGECRVATGRLLVDVLQAAMRLQVVPLVLAASKAMRKRLSAETALAIWQHAETNNLKGLRDDALLVAARDFEAVSATDEWLRAPAQLVVQLLCAERLHVSSESRVFEAAARWLAASAAPEENAAAVFSCVRFALLPREYVLERVLPEPMLQSGAAMKLVAMAGWEAPAHGAASTARCGFDRCIYALGGLDRATNSLSSVERYSVTDNRWVPSPPLTVARSHSGVVTMDSLHSCTIYVLGGHASGQSLSSVECFNPSGERWEAGVSMPAPRYAFGAAVVEGLIYVIGGRRGEEILKSVERFDPGTGEWESMPGMSYAREGCGVAVLDEAIYVMGGFDGVTHLNSVERFSIKDDCWEVLPPMNSGRMGCGAAAVGGGVYVMGGYSEIDVQESRIARMGSVNSVERYDVGRGVWDLVAPMTTPRMGCGVVACDDDALYVVGGRSSGEVLESVERYDLKSSTWQSQATLLQARSACALAISQ